MNLSSEVRVIRVVEVDQVQPLGVVQVEKPLIPPAPPLSPHDPCRWQSTAHEVARRILQCEKATPTLIALPKKALLAAVRADPSTPPKRPARFRALFFVLDH